MPTITITITDADDAKLKRLVTEPFEQTRESIIRDLIEQELARRSALVAPQPDGDLRRLDPDSPGDLAHSRVIAAAVAGQELTRPKWNGVREAIHLLGLKRLGSFGTLEKNTSARVRPGKYESDGFKHLPEGGFSIQGVDANLCWAQSLKLARALDVPISLTIEWREKDGAAHPGERAVLEWCPRKA